MATTEQSTTASSNKLKEKLQQGLDEAKQRLENARQEIANLREEDKASIHEKAAAVQQRIEQQRDRAQEMRNDAEAWMKAKKEQSDEAVKSWRERREIKHLENRAERAEEYAMNSVVIATFDAEEAELAVLDALAARIDADAAAAAR